MADGFEWVFLMSYASLGVAGLMILHGAYTIIAERRERKAVKRDPRRHTGPWRQA